MAQKIIAVRVPKVSIEAVRNGFRLTVEDGKQDYVTISSFSEAYARSIFGAVGGSSGGDTKKAKPAPKRVTPSGEYVFPDFASLTAWLRKNITHGNGVEA